MKAPCKDCPDRQLDCHSKCERYKAYQEEREAYREKKKQATMADCYIIQKVRKLKKGDKK